MAIKTINTLKDSWFDLSTMVDFTKPVVIQNRGYDFVVISYEANPQAREGFMLKAGEALRVKDQSTVKVLSPNFTGVIYAEEEV